MARAMSGRGTTSGTSAVIAGLSNARARADERHDGEDARVALPGRRAVAATSTTAAARLDELAHHGDETTVVAVGDLSDDQSVRRTIGRNCARPTSPRSSALPVSA